MGVSNPASTVSEAEITEVLPITAEDSVLKKKSAEFGLPTDDSGGGAGGIEVEESSFQPPCKPQHEIRVVNEQESGVVNDDSDLMGHYAEWLTAVSVVDDGERTLGELVNVLISIEALERNHSTQLQHYASKLKIRDTELPCVQTALDAFVDEMKSRAYHSMEFADALRSDVINGQLRTGPRSLENEVHEARSAVVRIATSLLPMRRAEHDDALRDLDRLGRMAYISAVRAQRGHILASSDFDRMTNCALLDACKVVQAESVYHDRLEAWDACRKEFVAKMTESYESLKRLEANRLEGVCTTLLKSCVHRAAQIRSNEYNLKKTIEIVQHTMTPESRENLWGNPVCRPLKVCDWPGIIESVKGLRKPDTKGSLGGPQHALTLRNLIGQAPFDAMVLNAQKIMGVNFAPMPPNRSQASAEGPKVVGWDEIREKIVPKLNENVAMDSSQEQILKDNIENITELFGGNKLDHDWDSLANDAEHIFYRYSICDALGCAVKTVGPCVASPDVFNVILKLCRSVLDWCDTADDFWCGRLIMHLSFKIHALEEEEAGSIHALNKALYTHTIWNRIQFWETAFVYSVSLEKQRESLERVWTALLDSEEMADLRVTFEKKNPYWDEMDKFPGYMYSFGIAINQIDKVLRDLCLRFGLSASFVSRMSRCIEALREKEVQRTKAAASSS